MTARAKRPKASPKARKPSADLRDHVPQSEAYEKRCAAVKVERIWVTSQSSGYPIGEYEVLQPRQEPSEGQELFIDALAADRLLNEKQATTDVPVAGSETTTTTEKEA